jgi:hypothetical protein
MMKDQAQKREVKAMPKIIHSPQSLEIVKQKYRQVNGTNKVLTSYFLRPDQKAIIDDLAGEVGMRQADIVRGMIDEWCEMILSGC